MAGAAGRAFEGDAGRVGEVAGLPDGRLDAHLELFGHGDLDLVFLTRRPQDADVGDAALWGRPDGPFGAGELAGLGQFVLGVSWWPGPKSFSTSAWDRWTWWAEISDRNRRLGLLLLHGHDQFVALDGAQGLPGHQALVIVGDDEDGDRRIVGRDDGVGTDLAEIAVLFLVELDAHVAQALAGQAAHRRTGFADVAGEGENVDTAHGGDVGADVLAHLVAEGLVGEGARWWPSLAAASMAWMSLEMPEMPFRPLSGIDEGGQGRRRHVLVLHQVDHHRRVDAARAAGHDEAVGGGHAMLVSTERPWSMAQSEAPMPRWQETISSSPGDAARPRRP